MQRLHLIAFSLVVFACGAETTVGVGEDAGLDGAPRFETAVFADTATGDSAVLMWMSCSEAVRFGRDGDSCAGDFPCTQCIAENGVFATVQVECNAGQLHIRRENGCGDAGLSDSAIANDATAGDSAASMNSATDGSIESQPDAQTFTDAQLQDAGVVDTGTTADGGGGLINSDAGASDGGMCAPREFLAPTTRCSEGAVYCATRSGLTQTQMDACWDTDPNCTRCFVESANSCATSMGCDDELGAAVCCGEGVCGAYSEATDACIRNSWNPGGACTSATTPLVQCRQALVSSGACRDTTIRDCVPQLTACGPEITPPPGISACAQSTRLCLANGGTIANCTQADPNTVACLSCFTTAAGFCATANGCADELGRRNCCLRATCPNLEQNCVNAALAQGGSCAAQGQVYDSCYSNVVQGTCWNLGTFDRCFPAT